MRTLLTALLTVSLWAQVPARDSRVAEQPNTNTHFQMPVYKTLAEWEARRARLREQILVAEDRPERDVDTGAVGLWITWRTLNGADLLYPGDQSGVGSLQS